MRIAVTSSDGENVDLHFGKGNSIKAIEDCDVAICLEFGFKAQIKASEANIKLVREEGTVKEALDSYINHINFMKNVKI